VLLANDVTVILCITEIPYAYTPYKDLAKKVSNSIYKDCGSIFRSQK